MKVYMNKKERDAWSTRRTYRRQIENNRLSAMVDSPDDKSGIRVKKDTSTAILERKKSPNRLVVGGKTFSLSCDNLRVLTTSLSTIPRPELCYPAPVRQFTWHRSHDFSSQTKLWTMTTASWRWTSRRWMNCSSFAGIRCWSRAKSAKTPFA